MIRLYGDPPFRVAVIHGGPGAPGFLSGVARHLSSLAGVVEPLQSKQDVAALIEELHDQIGRSCTRPVVLVGHAWGAWLSLLYAAAYPQDVRQAVLVGCAPLDAGYAFRIHDCRRARMSREEWMLFNRLVFRLERAPREQGSWLIQQIDALLEKTDYYELCMGKGEQQVRLPFNPEGYLRIWQEAEAMCESGELLRRIRHIRCALHVIHGEYDPRPAEGITLPLQANCIPFRHYLLPQCGHVPFREKYGAAPFYAILREIIQDSFC